MAPFSAKQDSTSKPDVNPFSLSTGLEKLELNEVAVSSSSAPSSPRVDRLKRFEFTKSSTSALAKGSKGTQEESNESLTAIRRHSYSTVQEGATGSTEAGRTQLSAGTRCRCQLLVHPRMLMAATQRPPVAQSSTLWRSPVALNSRTVRRPVPGNGQCRRKEGGRPAPN